ncbi:MAG: hypothetical protein QOI34_439 [Verrucomicrobiota bacterium]
MGRLRRIVLWFVVALIALGAIGLLVVNLYVQSQGTQARIQQELSQRLGTPIHIRGISVTPWGGLTLTGISIPQNSSTNSSDFLEAKSFHLHVRFLSLFKQRLVIKEVSLLEPTVVWPQNVDGKWRLPGSRRLDQQSPGENEVATPAATPLPEATVAQNPPITASTPMVEPKARNSENKVDAQHTPVPEVRRVNIIDGSFRFLDRSGNLVAMFEGVRFHSSIRESQALRGGVSIAKISLRDRFYLEALESPLHYDPLALDLPKISARAGGGELKGHFTIQPQSEDSPFTASVNFSGVQADQIVTEAGGPKGMVQGKLEGSFEAAGKTADANALAGKGEVFLRQGKLQQYSLLVALGQILQIEELTQLELQQAEVKYHITPDLVTIDDLILQSPNIRLSATGTITFKGKLRLDSQLAINDKVRSQLFQPIRDNFQPLGETGYSAIKFEVGGTVDHPKTNLMEKVVGRNLKDFVNGLFGGTKSDRPKRKKSRDAGADVTPQPSASPIETPALTPTATATPP